jgi:NNP family nitrate/nitrite transporter-like MFS transporter
VHLRDFARSGHPPTLFSAFLYFDVSFMVWVLIGALGVYIARDFGLTASQKGLLVAIPILGGSLFRVPMGILTDRIGPRKTGLLRQLIVLLPLAWGWLYGHSLPQMMALGLLLGVAGASFAVALPLASRWYPPQHQGLAMGIAGAGNSGTVIAALFAPRLAEALGWHAVFGLALIPVLLTCGVYLALAKDSPEQPAPRPWGTYLAVLREADTWWFNVLYGVTFGGFVGLASFLAIFFHDQYGLSKVMAGNFTALCVFAGSMFRPLGGYLADRVGGVRMLKVLFGAVALLMFGVGLLPPLALVTVLLFLGMLCLGMGNGAVFQLVPQRFRQTIGVVTGVVGAAGGVGGFLLPSFLGIFKDITGSYGTGFFCFAGMAGYCLLALRGLEGGWRAGWLPVLDEQTAPGELRHGERASYV